MVKMPDSKEVTTTNENMMIEAVKEMTRSIKDQLAFSTTEAMKNTQQNNNLMEQLIKAQERRDLDPSITSYSNILGKRSRTMRRMDTENQKCLSTIRPFTTTRINQ